MTIEPGIVFEEKRIVQEDDAASANRDLSLPQVLSTPRMIGWMETASYKVVADHLEPGQTTVGAVVNVRHLAATPLGSEVRIRSELLEVNGRRLRFQVDAWDGIEKIGEGEHERFIIDCDRFNRRLDEKKAKLTEM